MDRKKLSWGIALSCGVFALSIITGAAILAWTPPSEAPTDGAINAPINTGGVGQYKKGDLGIKKDGSLAYWLTQIGDSLGFKNNSGQVKMVIGQDGNVGIGTTDPSKKLDVDGYVKGRSGLCIGSGANEKCCATWNACLLLANGGCLPVGGTDCSAASPCCTGATCVSGSCVSTGGPGPGPDPDDPNGPKIPDSPCADGPEDGTNMADKRIFVTSTIWPNNEYTTSNYDHVRAAIDTDTNPINKICNDAAAAGGLPRNFRALYYAGTWLDRNSYWEPNKQLQAAQYWNGKRLADGVTCKWYHIAQGPNDFFKLKDGVNYLNNPIQFNERGMRDRDLKVWTGFRPINGGNYERFDRTKAVCGDGYSYFDTVRNTAAPLTATSRFLKGGNVNCFRCEAWLGSTSKTDAEWAFDSVDCSEVDNAAIYCVER